MNPSTTSQIQKELIALEHKQVVDICLRLAKYKKENKELLHYLLFEANDESTFISSVRTEIDQLFLQINTSSMYYIRKSVRKILRHINRAVKFSGIANTELDLRIHFCIQLKSSSIPLQKSDALLNLYQGQIEKIKKTLTKLHEDLQYDYVQELVRLEIYNRNLN